MHLFRWRQHISAQRGFCAWLLCCGFSETAYEIESCSLGLYQSFLSHASGLSHNHFFATSDRLDTTQTEDRPPSPDTWAQNTALTEEEFAELRGYRVSLGCAQFFASPPRRWSQKGLLMLQSAEQKVHEYASYLDSWKCVWEAAIEKHAS